MPPKAPPPPYLVPTNDVVPALKGLSPISARMSERVSFMRELAAEEGGPKLDYILFGAGDRMCGVQISEEASSMQSLAVTVRPFLPADRFRALIQLCVLRSGACWPRESGLPGPSTCFTSSWNHTATRRRSRRRSSTPSSRRSASFAAQKRLTGSGILNLKPFTRYGVDVHVSIALGGAPPTDEDYERVEAKLEEAVRNEGNVVPVTKK